MLYGALAGLVERHARMLVAGWLLLAAVLVLAAPSLQSVATQDAAAFLPAEAPSEVADRVSRRAFPDDPARDSAIVVFERRDGTLTAADRAHIARVSGYLHSDAVADAVAVVQSADRQPDLASFLQSRDGHAELLVVSFQETSFSPSTVQAIESIRHELSRDGPVGLDAHLTGFAGLAADQVAAVESSFSQTAIVTLALVLIILLFIYRAPVAALVPLVTIGVAFLTARALVAFLADAGLSVSGQAETFMVVMIFGAGTDYCLFLVSRYRDLQSTSGVERPLRRATVLVGPVIAASGFTVIVGFASQAAAKSGLYKTMGPAIAVAITVTLVASLTLTPALLHLLGRATFWPRHTAPTAQSGAGSPRWQRRARAVAARPTVFLIAGLLLLQLPAAGLGWFQQSFDLIEELPASADAKVGFDALSRHYPPGVVSPVFVVISADHSLLGNAEVTALDQLTSDLRGVPGVAQVRSLPLPAGEPLTDKTLSAVFGTSPDVRKATPFGPDLDPNKVDVTPLYAGLKSPGGLRLSGPLLRQYPQITNRLDYLLSKDRRTTRLVLSLDGNPYDNTALSTFRTLDDVTTTSLAGSALTGARVHLTGPSAFYVDIRESQGRDFRTIVAILLLGIFAVLMVLLRSLLAPLYLLATVLLSFAATLGITVAVFQGLLGHSGISFFVPPLLFVVLVALGADYNIFIVGRIREEMARGLSVRDATQLALAATGSVITSAGLIMAGTFAALMVSPLANLRQMGFAVTVGVLLDTLVVRTLLVPSLVMLTGRYAFWPSGLREHGPIPRWQLAGAALGTVVFAGGLALIATGGSTQAPSTVVLAQRTNTQPLNGSMVGGSPTPSGQTSLAPRPTPSRTPGPAQPQPSHSAAPVAAHTALPTSTPAMSAPSPASRIAVPQAGNWAYHVEGDRRIGAAGSTQPYTEDVTTAVSQLGTDASAVQLETSTGSDSDTQRRRYGRDAVQLTYVAQSSGAISFEGDVTPPVDLIRWPATTGASWTQDFTAGGTRGHRVATVKGTRTITLPFGSYQCTVIHSRTDLSGDATGTDEQTACWSAELGMIIDEQRHQQGTYNAVPFELNSRYRLTARP